MSVIDAIFNLYKKHGKKDYIGEPVSQTEHMLQAAMLAEEDKQPVPVVLAALFHDIGHLVGMERGSKQMDGIGTMFHEKIGAEFLRENNIPEPIPSLVEEHVQGKRYLCYSDKKYLKNISYASGKTLLYQGGIMFDTEAKNFEKSPYFNEILKLRIYDDKAKEINKETRELEYYRNLLNSFLSN